MSTVDSRSKFALTLIALGTIVWVIAAVALAITGAESKIIWTCVSGAALGAWGYRYSKRRAARGQL
jgi:hypothetical protein